MTESLKNGVILCKCRGHIAGSLPLDEIRQFLQQRLPDMEVTTADDLCQPGALRQCAEEQGLRPCVVGACSQLEHQRHFWKEAEELGCDAYSLRIVDLLKETSAPFSTGEMAARAKLLLWSQISRQSEFKGVPQDKLKLHFPKPEGEMSRRDLLLLALPRYEVIPFVEATMCRADQGCQLCMNACPLKAIETEEYEVVIDTTICNGCGACIAACPYGAIVYPTFSPEELDKELEGLLLPKDVVLEPRIIAAACQGCLPASGKEGAEQLACPPNVLPLPVPCLALVSPWLMLRAFDRGAQGFALIASRGKCHCGLDSSQWQEKVRFVQELLDCWHIEPERLRVFEVDEDAPHSVEQELAGFVEEIARLNPTPLGMSEPASAPTGGWLLPALIKDMSDRLGNPPGIVSAGDVPFGKVELDGSRCTDCGLCAIECPTEALTVASTDETDHFQLVFKHDACVACGSCTEICPEKCLRLEHVLELNRIDSPPVVLLKDEMVKCRQCGSPVAPRRMIDQLRARLADSSESVLAQLELCPTCRIKSQFGPGSAVSRQAPLMSK